MASGSIVKRASGNYAVVYYVDGKQKWKTIGPNKKEAERALTQIMGQVHRGEYQAPKDILFRDLCDKWLKKSEAAIKPSTLDFYRVQIERRLKPAFGHLQTRAISTEIIDLFVSELSASCLSPRTVAHSLTVLKTIFKTAEQWGYLSKDPAKAVKKPRVPKVEMDFLNPAEINKLLAATDQRHYALLLTACMTGLRRGELLGLKWEDIDFNAKTISVRRSVRGTILVETKSAHSVRRVSISDTLIKALRELQTRLLVDGPDNPLGLIFPSEVGTPIDGPNLLRRIFWPTLTRAGLRRVRFHDLRHSYAALAISRNVPLKVIQRQLGHSSIQITADTYGHLLPETESAAAAELEAAIFGADRVCEAV
ncbi:MAG: tyrosine-type recombinase/integrase [Actinomycetota bacterium]|nr:tyrosine-type recombinase/integrase [Actinomycetota bacterium]